VSIKLMNAAFVIDMRPSDKLVLLALADNASDEACSRGGVYVGDLPI
jgi:hypothetical protein